MQKKTPKTVVFTEAEKQAMQGAAYAVWSECAYDVLQSEAEERHTSVERVTVSRSLAMEIALDAGRMEDHLRDQMRRDAASRSPAGRRKEAANARQAKRGGWTYRPPSAKPIVVTPELLTRIDAADYDTLIAAVRPAFGYARYGL